MPHTANGAGWKSQDTSRDAAAKAKVSDKSKILAKFRSLPPNVYLTADDCALNLNMDPLSIRPRISELYKEGKLYKTNIRMMGQRGRKQIAWRAV